MPSPSTQSPSIRVAAVDDHPVVLRGIAAALAELAPDIAVVAVAESVDELLAGPGAQADVVLLDLQMPHGAPAEDNIRRLAAAGMRVLIYTSEERAAPLRRAVAAGASGLLLKIDPVEAIVAAIRDSLVSEVVHSGPLAEALVEDPDLIARLSPRQIEILQAISDGLPYKSIARRLGITEATLREHLARAGASYRQRGVEPGNAHGLVRRAVEDGHIER